MGLLKSNPLELEVGGKGLLVDAGKRLVEPVDDGEGPDSCSKRLDGAFDGGGRAPSASRRPLVKMDC